MVTHNGRLSEGQRRVALQAEVDPWTFATSSVTEIAAAAGVSEATVVRTAQRLGFDGLKEMKSAVFVEKQGDIRPSELLTSRLEALGSDVEGSVLKGQASVLESMRDALAVREYADLLTAANAARRVVFFGVGTAHAVAEYASIEARRSGLDALSLTGGGHALADVVVSLRASDCVVILAPLIFQRDIRAFAIESVHHAGSAFLITQNESLVDRPVKLTQLRIPQTMASAASETFALFVFIDIFIARLSSMDSPRSLAARHRLQAMREKLRANDT